MNDLVPLHFAQANVRLVIQDGEPWWVMKDIAAILGIKNARDAAARLWDWQRDDVGIPDAIGRLQKTIIVNEAGVYALVLVSNRPIAEQFARWLFTEVLPSIRQFGMYPPPRMAEIDAHDEWDGLEKPLSHRFREERERWEAIAGYRLSVVPSMSAHIIRAIEAGHGGVTKGQRLQMLTCAGLDVLYILTGRRTVSPRERRVIEYIRTSSDPRKLALLAAAHSD